MRPWTDNEASNLLRGTIHISQRVEEFLINIEIYNISKYQEILQLIGQLLWGRHRCLLSSVDPMFLYPNN